MERTFWLALAFFILAALVNLVAEPRPEPSPMSPEVGRRLMGIIVPGI